MNANGWLVIVATVAGVAVGFLGVVARRKATWPWRIAAMVVSAAGVIALWLATEGTYLMPMMVFLIFVVSAQAFDRRDAHRAQ